MTEREGREPRRLWRQHHLRPTPQGRQEGAGLRDGTTALPLDGSPCLPVPPALAWLVGCSVLSSLGSHL